MDRYDLKKEGDKWKFGRESGERPLKTFETKEKGMKHSTQYVKERGGSLKIRKENGQYQEERTYPRSADPRRSKG